MFLGGFRLSIHDYLTGSPVQALAWLIRVNAKQVAEYTEPERWYARTLGMYGRSSVRLSGHSPKAVNRNSGLAFALCTQLAKREVHSALGALREGLDELALIAGELAADILLSSL